MLVVLFFPLFFASLTAHLYGSVVINEFMPSNSDGSGFRDQFGEYPDWIELFNTSNAPVNLQGWVLERDGGERTWTFPSVVVEPLSHLVVAASGRNVREVGVSAAPFSIFSRHVSAYADQYSDPPGNSTWSYNLFAGSVVGTIDGVRVFSASFNYQHSAALGYGYAGLQLGFNGSSNHINTSVDLTDFDYLSITARITPAMDFNARITQAGLDTWLGYAQRIRGTGEIEEYIIPLRGNTEPLDLSIVTGIVFEATGAFGERTIDVFDVTFYSTQQYLHTSFPLAQSASIISLRNNLGTRVDSRTYPHIPTDVTVGRSTDGSAQWSVFIQGTPGGANTNGFLAIAETVRFSHRGGFYNSPFNLTLSRNHSASRIHYTTDGSDPTENSNLYSTPIHISRNTVVKARVFGDNLIPGEIISQSYLFSQPRQIGVVSLSIDPNTMFHPDTGMYSMGPNAIPEIPHFGANFWQDIEAPVHIELFEPPGSSQSGFNFRAGLEIYGGWSRSNDQKSLAIHFRNKYGEPNINYPVFPHRPHLTHFNDLILRNSGNDQSYTMMRDAMVQTLMSGILDYHQHRPVAVYINGEYWGLYNIRERTNRHYFITNYYGVVNADSVDILENESAIRVGSNTHYVAMLDFAQNSDLSVATNYAQIQEMMDVHNYIDYVSTQLYSANADWPGNNIRFWRERPNGRWRWILQDLDFGFGIYGDRATSASSNSLARLVDPNGPNWPNPPWSTALFRSLIRNGEFRNDFINRYATLMNTRFRPDRVVGVINSMASVISDEMVLQRARWRYWNNWDEEVEVLREFARTRIPHARNHLRTQFDLGTDARITLNAVNGRVSINDFVLENYPFSGDYFAGTPIRIRAIGNTGFMFSHWSDGNREIERNVDPANNINLEAIFVRDPNVSIVELPDEMGNVRFSSSNTLKVFPVPASSSLSIAYSGEGVVNDIAVYDINGELVKKIKPETDSNIIGQWNLKNQYSNKVDGGVYFVAIEVILNSGRKTRLIQRAIVVDE